MVTTKQKPTLYTPKVTRNQTQHWENHLLIKEHCDWGKKKRNQKKKTNRQVRKW